MWTSVKSSNIKELAHEGNALKVRFLTGTEYHYGGVPESVYNEIVNAPSVGKAFIKLVKNHPQLYPFQRVTV